MSDPINDVEWQEACDAAHGALILDSARKYGFVTGGPEIDVPRCEEIINRALTEHGISPSQTSVEDFLDQLS